MLAYFYILLTDTNIVPTGIIIIHVYTSISFVYNDTLIDGSNNWYAVKDLVLISKFHLAE